MVGAEILHDIALHAGQCQPAECCGLIVAINEELGYWPCRNVAAITGQFQIHAEDWAEAEDIGAIKAVVHSHVNRPAEPSQPDLIGCEQSGLPWIIFSWPSAAYRIIQPNGYQLPLLGREFHWGLTDCFTLVRDYYRQNLNITLDSPPGGYPQEFWKKGQKFYSRFEEWGFIEVPHDEPPQVNDIFLMLIRSDDEPNHAGIYLGDGIMLHHLEHRLSERVPYGGFWQKTTRYVVRHKSLLYCAND